MDEKKDESRASSRALLATNSNDPSALRTAGIALMRGGDPKHAAEAFAREYAVDSASTSIYNQACALALAHETAPALAALRRSIYAGYGDSEKFRSDDDLASLRGEAEFRTLSDLADDLSLQIYMTDGFGDSRWRKQMPRLEQAAREHADAGRAWWNLGFGQLRMGDPESSLDSFGRALDRGYRASNTLYNMACASAQRHDPDAALGYLARAEKAGMEVGKVALDDHDLDPIRSDSRFRAMADRWRDERRDETMNKFIGKSKDKDRK
jgi:tetratricopeptide (TPR) repeat protein